MPKRNIVLANEEIYHVFNKTLDNKFVFKQKRDLERAISCLWYYRFNSPPLPYSRYLELPSKNMIVYHNRLVDAHALVEVYAFCLMSNHFHLLLKQKVVGGISKYISNFSNSFTRFFNNKNERRGSVFLTQFKAVHIESDEQLVHVSRYIHLNPLTGYLVSNLNQLFEYKWSSLTNYLNNTKSSYDFVETSKILDYFGTADKYTDFVSNQAEYHRELDKIRHLTLE